MHFNSPTIYISVQKSVWMLYRNQYECCTEPPSRSRTTLNLINCWFAVPYFLNIQILYLVLQYAQLILTASRCFYFRPLTLYLEACTNLPPPFLIPFPLTLEQWIQSHLHPTDDTISEWDVICFKNVKATFCYGSGATATLHVFKRKRSPIIWYCSSYMASQYLSRE
jgi:hypothetical protein